jgi:hypothetical protein
VIEEARELLRPEAAKSFREVSLGRIDSISEVVAISIIVNGRRLRGHRIDLGVE